MEILEKGVRVSKILYIIFLIRTAIEDFVWIKHAFWYMFFFPENHYQTPLWFSTQRISFIYY